jgi:hypothetical protein
MSSNQDNVENLLRQDKEEHKNRNVFRPLHSYQLVYFSTLSTGLNLISGIFLPSRL